MISIGADEVLWPAERTRGHLHDLYVHLRTRLPVDECFADFRDLAVEADPGLPVGVCSFPIGPDDDPWAECGYWNRNVLLRWRTGETPRQFVARMRAILDRFEAWQVHDRRGSYVEFPQPSLLEMFYGAPGADTACSMLILNVDSEHRFADADVDRVIAALPTGSRTVAHFDDGRIILIPAPLTPEQFRARMPRASRISAIGHWGGVGAQNEAFCDGEVCPELFESLSLEDFAVATPREDLTDLSG